MNMKEITFNEFCERFCDGLYDPKFSDDNQCTGYILLKKMVVEKIEPATLEDIKRWECNPTEKELYSIPDIKYLRFLHPILRTFIIENWNNIKNLKV
jgi:hypothetical protein